VVEADLVNGVSELEMEQTLDKWEAEFPDDPEKGTSALVARTGASVAKPVREDVFSRHRPPKHADPHSSLGRSSSFFSDPHSSLVPPSPPTSTRPRAKSPADPTGPGEMADSEHARFHEWDKLVNYDFAGPNRVTFPPTWRAEFESEMKLTDQSVELKYRHRLVSNAICTKWKKIVERLRRREKLVQTIRDELSNPPENNVTPENIPPLQDDAPGGSRMMRDFAVTRFFYKRTQKMKKKKSKKPLK